MESSLESQSASPLEPSSTGSSSPDLPTNGKKNGTRDAEELELKAKLRAVAILTLLVTIVIEVLLDSFGRLVADPSFHIGDTVFGMLIAAFLGLLGVEGIDRITKRNGK